MTERKPQEQDRYIVRFPDGMRDKLKSEAAKNNRSLNAEIVARLEQTLNPRDFPSSAAGEDLAAIVERVIRKVREEERRQLDNDR